MTRIISILHDMWTGIYDNAILSTLFVALLAILLLKSLSLIVRRILVSRSSAQFAMLGEKLLWYGGFMVVIAITLAELHVDLTALLGAVGIAGIAISLASQSSLSNIISGLFLVVEKPFEVGDLIRVNDKRGVVLSIDLLSIKIRTMDNLFIRIPNESVLKTDVTTVTRFPIRRMDIDIQVAYKEDLERVVEVLKEVAMDNPAALDEPEPLILIKGFGESAVDILFGVWFNKPDYLAVKNCMMMDVKKRFEQEGIEIPFPHLSLYTGAATLPFPVSGLSPDSKPNQPDVFN